MIPAQLLVYGEAGKNVIDDVLPNTQQNTTRTVNATRTISVPLMLIGCILLLIISVLCDLPSSIPLLAFGALFVYSLYKFIYSFYRNASVQHSRNSSTKSHDKRLNAWRAVTQQGVDVRDAGFDKADLPAVYGALGERNTDKYLQRTLTSPKAQGNGPFVIMHGLTMRSKKTSNTSFDIDHLVLREHHGGVVVDTKVFREAPAPTLAHRTRDNTRGYILKRDTPHWQIISTCIHEASQLNASPHAIYIAIGGTAARDKALIRLWAQHNNKVPITKYVDRFHTQRTIDAPLPIYLVPQREIGNIVLADLLRSPQAAHSHNTLSSHALLANHDIYIDPTPTASFPQKQ